MTVTFDLQERTAKLGEQSIIFARTLLDSTINKPLISQLIRASTSIGANYMEADGAESRKDFVHKLGICKKEAKETMHWSRMIATANPDRATECRQLWKESHELVLIFSTIISKSRN